MEKHTILGLVAQIKCGLLDAKGLSMILEEILGFYIYPIWYATSGTNALVDLKYQLTI